MNIAKLSLKYKTFSIIFMALLLIGGIIAFSKLNKMEEPILSSKTALITTHYAGASPLEVEEEISQILESGLKELSFIDKISSISSEGVSNISIQLSATLTNKQLPQAWQIVQDKVNELKKHLPTHVKKPIVNTAPDEMFNIVLAITGNGFTPAELKTHTDQLKQKLSTLSGVNKLVTWGEPAESIDIYLPQKQFLYLGIPEKAIYSKLKNQNLQSYSGKISIDHQNILIRPMSITNPIEEIGNLIIQHQANKIIHLNDIADISRNYVNPTTLMRYNGDPAIGLALSIEPKNAIKIGKEVKQKINAFKEFIPAGVEIETISFQPNSFQESIISFGITAITSFIIISMMLILTLGIRCGLLQAFIIVLSFSATLIMMYWMRIDLERVSSGALIIALCLLINNNIILNQSISRQVQQGKEIVHAAIDGVQKNIWLLLIGTLVLILAISPIILSQNIASEYTHSFFMVLSLSLILGWIISILMTPLLYSLVLTKDSYTERGLISLYLQKLNYGVSTEGIYHRNTHKTQACTKKDQDENSANVAMNARQPRGYEKIVTLALCNKKHTILLFFILLVASCIGFTLLKQSFLPNSDRNQFMIHYWLPQGSDIERTSQQLQKIENYLTMNDKISSISSFIGAGAPKFLLNYQPESLNPSYAFQLIKIKNMNDLTPLISQIDKYISENYPDAKANIEKLKLGPPTSGTIKVRFSGEDPGTLRQLADNVIDIYQQSHGSYIYHNWRNKIPVVRPELDEISARASGVTKKDIANALEEAFAGRKIGIYQDQKGYVPIMAHRTFDGRQGFETLYDLLIWSPVAQKSISIQQVINKVEMIWENPFLFHYNQARSIEVQSHFGSLTYPIFKKIKQEIQNIKLPSDYTIGWEGEYEEAKKAEGALLKIFIFISVVIALLLILYFNNLRQPFLVLLCVPLTIIGVTLGLWITQSAFGYMSMLGLLVLWGIMLKNTMVFVEKSIPDIESINLFCFCENISTFYLNAGLISMGLLPLLTNDLFRETAIILIFGLVITTIIMSLLVPVLFSFFEEFKTRKILMT